MNCPECGAWSSVKQTKMPRRRRECANGHRFTTEERCIDLALKEQKRERMNAAQALSPRNKPRSIIHKCY